MQSSFRNIPRLIKLLFIALLYFLLAVVSLQLSFRSTNATPIWPPSGLAFAVLLLWGRSWWPGILIGAVSANLYTFLLHDTPLFPAVWVSLVIAIGNTGEALAGFALVHRLLPSLQGRFIGRTVSTVVAFSMAAMLMCLVSCTIGTMATYLGGMTAASDFFWVWFTWWTGDVSGIVLLTPFLISMFGNPPETAWMRAPDKLVETAVVTTAVVVVSGIVFHGWGNTGFIFTRSFILTPLLILAAVRWDQWRLTGLVLIAAAMAVAGTMAGKGPYIAPTLNESLITVEAFVSIHAIMVLLLHAAVRERRENENFLRTTSHALEDIVARRTQELQDKNRQLEERNSELRSFSYSVSHDLQEPVRKIDFFTQKMMQEDLPEPGNDLLRRIQSATRQMKKLVENLLSYSRVDLRKRNAEKTDLNTLLKQVKHDLSETITETGADIVSDTLPELTVVRFEFHQLFMQLVGNALKFRLPGTRPFLHIGCEVVPGHLLPQPLADAERNYYRLSFTDQGIGFEPEYAGKIFDLLQKLHGQNEYEGSGIGLALCKKVVEQHHGLIQATGMPGKGATFFVYLPLSLAEVGEQVKQGAEKQNSKM